MKEHFRQFVWLLIYIGLGCGAWAQGVPNQPNLGGVRLQDPPRIGSPPARPVVPDSPFLLHDGPNPTTPAPVMTVNSMSLMDDQQKLGVGDRLLYRVIEDQDDPRWLFITDSGDLDVPELGLVHAVNKTCKKLAEEVKAALEKTTYYHATVIIVLDQMNKTISGRKVYVVGQVKLTGPQDIPAGEGYTVSKAILRAGGFADFADKKHVRVIRGGGAGGKGKQTFVVNVIQIWERGKLETDLPLEDEDLVYVPARAVNF
jgi:polysaccharide export outer membrane protein